MITRAVAPWRRGAAAVQAAARASLVLAARAAADAARVAAGEAAADRHASATERHAAGIRARQKKGVAAVRAAAAKSRRTAAAAAAKEAGAAKLARCAAVAASRETSLGKRQEIAKASSARKTSGRLVSAVSRGGSPDFSISARRDPSEILVVAWAAPHSYRVCLFRLDYLAGSQASSKKAGLPLRCGGRPARALRARSISARATAPAAFTGTGTVQPAGCSGATHLLKKCPPS